MHMCGQVSMKHTIQFQVIRQAERHLEEVTKERSLYRKAVDTAKESVRQCFSSTGTFTPPGPASKTPSCSRAIEAHYSFDMAQQVFYPNDPQQPGPMYFLTPRGQNKNNAMVGYLLWRVLAGLHNTITLSFMISGHTKFSPDWCFGLLKKR